MPEIVKPVTAMVLTDFHLNWCTSLLDKLEKKPTAAMFKTMPKAMTESQFFYRDPKQKIDLDTVRTKLKTDKYESVNEFGLDVRQVFLNNKSFYPQAHPLYQMASDLLNWFEERWNQYPRNSTELWIKQLKKCRDDVQMLINTYPINTSLL